LFLFLCILVGWTNHRAVYKLLYRRLYGWSMDRSSAGVTAVIVVAFIITTLVAAVAPAVLTGVGLMPSRSGRSQSEAVAHTVAGAAGHGSQPHQPRSGACWAAVIVAAFTITTLVAGGADRHRPHSVR
jgi:hypothetical protein